MKKFPFKLLSLGFLGFLLLSSLGSMGCGGGSTDQQDPPIVDHDGDGIADSADNCPSIANADQKDTDQDGLGDACDLPNPLPPPPPPPDTDGDGIEDSDDNCPNIANDDQKDDDEDGMG